MNNTPRTELWSRIRTVDEWDTFQNIFHIDLLISVDNDDDIDNYDDDKIGIPLDDDIDDDDVYDSKSLDFQNVQVGQHILIKSQYFPTTIRTN